MESRFLDNELKWSKANTKLLLSLYTERIDDFRNSNIKKKVLWQEILDEMMQYGVKVECTNHLDRKFRNLKKTYDKIVKRNSTTDRATSRWVFFDEMDAIFKNHVLTADSSNCVSDEEAIVENLEIGEPLQCFLDEPTDDDSTCSENCDVQRSVQAVENRRADEMAKLVKVLNEHNRIQQRRNELLKMLIDKLPSPP